MTDAELRELAALVEVPDCDHPLDLSCPCQESCPPGTDCPCCRGECDHPPLNPLADQDSPHFGYQPPCACILARGKLRITFDQFRALLIASHPRAYAERPVDPEPSHCLTRRARVEVLAERRRLGYSLWNPLDWLPGDDWLDFLGRTAEKSEGNHRPQDTGEVVRIGGNHAA